MFAPLAPKRFLLSIATRSERLTMSEPAGKSESIWGRQAVQWAIIFGVWTLAGLVMSGQDYIRYLRANRPVDWYRLILLAELPFSYLWALLTPFLVWLARRFPIERGRLRRSIFTHVSVSLLLSLLTMAGFNTLSAYLFVPEAERDLSTTGLLLRFYTFFDYYVLLYWLIVIAAHLSDYHDRFLEGRLRSSRIEAQMAQAQLEALKTQLQPHFLFNTLHAISALQHKDVTAAHRLIARLGEFLRLALDNSGTQEVPLEKELAFLQSYLDIERIRFQDRLTFNIEVEPQALQARVPNLVLQPIVENAIKHAIAPFAVPGRIDIRVKRNNGMLHMQVQDSGRGPGECVESDEATDGAVCLTDIRTRLERLYGTGYLLALYNIPGGGLRITVEVPLTAAAATRVMGGNNEGCNADTRVNSRRRALIPRDNS